MLQQDIVAIPQPPKKLIVGNALEIVGHDTAIEALMALAREYGEIYQLDLPQYRVVVATSGRLVQELCDDKRFDKKVGKALEELQPFGSPGLFTARTDDPRWKKAHNILLPNFSQSAMKNYHPMMLDIASQLVRKWDRAAEQGSRVDVPADFTRLTFDTIGLCGFGYRFESFQHEKPHPFVEAMVGYLGEAQAKMGRLPLIDFFCVAQHKKYWDDVGVLNRQIDAVIAERKASAQRHHDLLSCMLEATDRESGEKLDDVNIRAQCLTFLVAGHETTSGLLSFAMYYLVKNPEVLKKAQHEVDRVLGSDLSVLPSYEQVRRLAYVQDVLKETLRLWPTAPGFSRGSTEDQVIGGRYLIPKGQQVMILTPMLHRDKAVFGDDADAFRPERFTEAYEAQIAGAYKPFGTGQRACIGRQFALHEATLVLGMVLQRYDPFDVDGYALKIKQTLTIKPDGLHVQLRRRLDAERAPAEVMADAPRPAAPTSEVTGVKAHHTPLLVLYGSNLGASQAFATRMSTDGAARGFEATLAPLDEWVGRLPREGVVLIVTSSYNGTPPDNAARFCAWLSSTEASQAGVRYAVFGCGNREWAATYQAIPHLVDSRLEALGAERVAPFGAADASDDFDGDFERWYAQLWPEVARAVGVEVGGEVADGGLQLDYEVLEERHPSPFVATFGARPMTVVTNVELQSQGSGRSTRHIEVALPEGVTYAAGDHLGVIPHNDPDLVKRVALRFGLQPETRVRLALRAGGTTTLPVGQIVSVGCVLGEYVELQEVATRRMLKAMADHTQCPPEKVRLLGLMEDDRYRDEVLRKGRSLIDLLEDFAGCEMPFNVYLAQLSPLKPRYYSISSSPLRSDRLCTITVGVVDAPARCGRGQYRGACSTYLARTPRGRAVYAFVRDTGSTFRLPAPSLPVIMVGPGTGLAPFRGFIEERAALRERGVAVGPSLLFFGCRHPEHDYIYRNELASYAAQGVISLEVAFSRLENGSKAYVQDLIRQRADEVWALLEQGGCVYVCGDGSRMAPDVRAAFVDVCKLKRGCSAEEAEAWISDLESSRRYLTDVWAAG